MTSQDVGIHSKDSPFRLLNEDCLTELISRCKTRDVLTLRRTCKFLATFIKDNQAVWVRRIASDFGVDLSCPPQTSSSSSAAFDLARYIHGLNKEFKPRFQAALVNGGIDEASSSPDDAPLNMTYWADNLFNPSGSPYCSDCSRNADAVALLLDDVIQADVERSQLRNYMISRCRYAAALLQQVQDPEHALRRPDELINVVNGWQYHHLEHFFLSLVDGLNENHPMGRLLLYDIPHEETEQEIERLHRSRDLIQNRSTNIARNISIINEESKTMFDMSLVPRIIDQDRKHLMTIVNELIISRRGSLTCPVASGVVFAGIIDFDQLKGLSGDEIGRRIHEATKDPVCTFFNDRTSIALGDPSFKSPHAPKLLHYVKRTEGYMYTFDTRDTTTTTTTTNDTTTTNQNTTTKKLVEWKPLVWFRFHSHVEASRFHAATRQYGVLPLTDISIKNGDSFLHRQYEVLEFIISQIDALRQCAVEAIETLREIDEEVQRNGAQGFTEEMKKKAKHEIGFIKFMYDNYMGLTFQMKKICPDIHHFGLLKEMIPFYDPEMNALIDRGIEVQQEYVGLSMEGLQYEMKFDSLVIRSDDDDDDDDDGDDDGEEKGKVGDKGKEIKKDDDDDDQSEDIEHTDDEEDESESDEDDESDEDESDDDIEHSDDNDNDNDDESMHTDDTPPLHFGLEEDFMITDDDDDDIAHPFNIGMRFSSRNTKHRAMMNISVPPCPANIIMIKLIDQENMMEALEDLHDWPNIDMASVKILGKEVVLPEGVQVASYASEMVVDSESDDDDGEGGYFDEYLDNDEEEDDDEDEEEDDE